MNATPRSRPLLLALFACSVCAFPSHAHAHAVVLAAPPALPPPRAPHASAAPSAPETAEAPASPAQDAPRPEGAAPPTRGPNELAPRPESLLNPATLNPNQDPATTAPPPPPWPQQGGTGLAPGPDFPELAEPPQPQLEGIAPAPGNHGNPPSTGTTAPAMNPAPYPPSLSAGAHPLLPDLEMPPRPETKGTGVFITAGVLFGTAIGEYVASHLMLARRCVRPLVGTDLEGDAADAYLAVCSVTMLQAGALKLHGSINALASIGAAAAAASIRARYDAHMDVFKHGRHRPTQKLRTAGTALAGAGLMTWLTSAVITWAGAVACTDLPCAERLRGIQNGLSLGSMAFVATGTAMVTYGILYERRHTQNATAHRQVQQVQQLKQLQLTPTAARGHIGITLVGQF
ncbi:MAG: hypothetical protein V3V08_10570 [Nannocystaceae bacterium]